MLLCFTILAHLAQQFYILMMRNYNKFLLVLIIFVAASISKTYAQVKGEEGIKWYTIEQAEALSKKNKKKIFIDVYTKWCGWCKNMDKTTLSQQHIIRYINENFYAVKLDAEQHSDITFKNKTYHYVTQSGVGFNELAADFLKAQMSYPTIIFLDEDLNTIQAIPGYRESSQFEMIMTYFGEDNHKKMPWTKYEKTYQPMKK
jgi:thioredoxin-related protein